MVRLLVLAVLGVLGGCATQMTEGGSQVRQILPEALTPCDFIAVVQGSENFAWTSVGDRVSALNKVRNQVAEMGGNAFVLSQTSTDEFGTTTQADAYRCPR